MMPELESKKQYFDVAPPAKNPQASSAKVMNHAKVPLLEDLTDDQAPSDALPTSGAPFKSDGLMESKEKGAEEDKTEEVSHDGFTITPLPEKDTALKTEDQPDDGAASETTDATPAEAEPEPSEEKAETDLGAQAVESAQEASSEPETKPELAPDTRAEPSADTGPEDSATGSGGQDAQESVDKDVPVNEEQFASASIPEDPGKKATDAAKAEMQDPKIYDTKEYYVPIGKTHHKHGGSKGAFAFGIICAVIVVAAALYAMYRLS